jgi:chromosome segregation ATPase
MANDKDIKIGLQTVGADAAASEIHKVEDAIDQIPETTPEAVTAVDKLDDAVKKVPDSVDDLNEQLDGLRERTEKLKEETEEFAKQQESATSKMRLGRSAMVGAGIGGAILAKTFGEIAKGLQSIDLDHLRKLDGAMAEQVETARSWAEVLTDPINGIQRLISGTTIGEVFGGMNEQLKLNAETEKRIAESRLEYALRNRAVLAEAYGWEAQQLIEQENALLRLLDLRSQMAAIRSEAAGQEVDAARLRGGDVPLAQANALSARLQEELQALEGSLQIGQQTLSSAQSAFDAAMEQYRAGVADGLATLDPEQLAQLARAVDATRVTRDDAEQALSDQKEIFDASKTNLLRGAETELGEIETETQGEISKAAQAARDAIYQTIKEEVSTIGSASGQVKQALDANRDQTVQAIQQLAPKPADTAKVQGALDAASQDINGFGNAVISSMTKLTAMVSQLTQKVTQQEAKIDQVSGRIR